MTEEQTPAAPALGKLVTGPAGRDAVHVAVAPVQAAGALFPGERVGLRPGGTAGRVPDREEIGIVDPFLPDPVRPGETFWLCLFPGTVTSLRHVWTHPAFAPKPPAGPGGRP